MKEANITLKLTKDHEVHKTNVTPLEVLLLVADHHKNVGGNPVEIDKTSIKEIVVKKADGKDGTRSNDEELDRLKTKYPIGKVKAIIAEVKDFPETFEAALERGTKLSLPSGALSTTKLL